MSTKFNKEVLKDNGLACPFEKSDPEKYKDILACKPGKGWSQVKDISYVILTQEILFRAR